MLGRAKGGCLPCGFIMSRGGLNKHVLHGHAYIEASKWDPHMRTEHKGTADREGDAVCVGQAPLQQLDMPI